MLEPLPSDGLMRCPHCAEFIRHDAILCRFCDKRLSDEHFYPCPFCAEPIRKEATICRFCQSEVGNVGLQSVAQLKSPESKSAAKSKLRSSLMGQLAQHEKITHGSYGSGVRQQVFEVIVRQAMAGAPWKEICAGPMEINNISIEEVERELEKRRKAMDDEPS